MSADSQAHASVKRQAFLGTYVDSISMEEALERIEMAIHSRSPHYGVALNVPKLWRMQRDLRLRRIVEEADMVLPEQVVVLASRICRHPLRAYIGNDRLTQAFLSVAAQRGYRLFFLGTRAEVLERMCARIRARYPGIAIAGWHHGYFADTDTEQICEFIRSCRPDVLFVGMGTPRQEYWIEACVRCLGVPMVIGVGGTLDVLAGLKRDCPQWIRNLGLEWIYRLVEDPRGKFKRYALALPWFVWALIVKGIFPRWLAMQASDERS